MSTCIILEETILENRGNYCEILHCVSWIVNVYCVIIEGHVRVDSSDKQSIAGRVKAVSYQSADTVMDRLERLELKKIKCYQENFIPSIKCY